MRIKRMWICFTTLKLKTFCECDFYNTTAAIYRTLNIFRDSLNINLNVTSQFDLVPKTEISSLDDESFLDFKYGFTCLQR